ncbi:MAG: helix-turn-helix domain-containing protein [Tannerellaceae bacterium]|nr:helix-turn-helix domain-containing protein [Tannerellaceae bacterium]
MNYERLNRILKDRKINNVDLAAKANLSPAAIGRIVNGGNCKVSSLRAISKALNVPITFFLEEEIGNNIAIGQQSIAGDGISFSVGERNIVSGDNSGTDQEAQNYKKALQIIATQKEEIISLQNKIIDLQNQLLEIRK